MTHIVHYFDPDDYEYEIDIYINNQYFGYLSPEAYRNLNQNHTLLKEAEHENVFYND